MSKAVFGLFRGPAVIVRCCNFPVSSLLSLRSPTWQFLEIGLLVLLLMAVLLFGSCPTLLLTTSREYTFCV